MVAQAAGAPLVRLRRDAEEGRPPDPRSVDRVHHVGRRHRRRLRGPPRPVGRRSAGGGHRRVRAHPGAPGARPDHRDLQRRRPAQRGGQPTAGRREAADRTRRRAAVGGPAGIGRSHRETDRRTGYRRYRAHLQRPVRRRAGRSAGVGGDLLHSVAVRGLLTACRGGDGQRHPHRRQPGRRIARGAGVRGPVRRTRHTGRRRGTDQGSRRSAGFPRTALSARHRRTAACRRGVFVGIRCGTGSGRAPR